VTVAVAGAGAVVVVAAECAAVRAEL